MAFYASEVNDQAYFSLYNRFLKIFLTRLTKPFLSCSYSEAENKQPEKKKIPRGDLTESVEGNGFLAKRKRSTPASISPTSFRYGARFLTIPALEFQVTD